MADEIIKYFIQNLQEYPYLIDEQSITNFNYTNFPYMSYNIKNSYPYIKTVENIITFNASFPYMTYEMSETKNKGYPTFALLPIEGRMKKVVPYMIYSQDGVTNKGYPYLELIPVKGRMKSIIPYMIYGQDYKREINKGYPYLELIPIKGRMQSVVPYMIYAQDYKREINKGYPYLELVPKRGRMISIIPYMIYGQDAQRIINDGYPYFELIPALIDFKKEDPEDPEEPIEPEEPEDPEEPEEYPDVFTNKLELVFEDDYLYRIINSGDRLILYVSYNDGIGGIYARRINPKFYDITFEGQNVKIVIKGFYTYKNMNTIYIVTGDINNHNMFFKDIDENIEYIDLAEIKTYGGNQLFKYLSYDNIISSNDLEINMNGYTLYPDIDYTIINGELTKDSSNLVLFRNKIPGNKEINIEVNLKPCNNAEVIYKTHQAYSLTRDLYTNTFEENQSYNKLKKLPISKCITLDNDKYTFMASNSNGITTNKFDLYIDNLKVPNKYIKIKDTKTIILDDKYIDLHKTHIAKKNGNMYELTNEYDKGNNDYRYFDPIYKNIMLVFQKKYNPYNYEIEIENKYSKENFNSLLKNLFFNVDEKINIDDKITEKVTRTDSCYVPSNDNNIYDNFDWLCESNGGNINTINENTKIDIINKLRGIIDCNKDDLDFNVLLDSEPLNNNILYDNLYFDCNPSIIETEIFSEGKYDNIDAFKFDSNRIKL